MNMAAENLADENSPILLFDGQCNLCNSWIQFVLARERDAQIRFAALQSDAGQAVLEDHEIPSQLDTIVLVEAGHAYFRSTAVLHLAKYLRAPWRWAGCFLWTPRVIRDFAYSFVAKRRYAMFGKSDTCYVPDASTRARFLG